ncbi:MAG: ABC transporter ATP-binding protein [Calditrichaeota bacterium]|nr:MAG: ABC transporter ATP-binding protein [Calditrichota bacterium]
MSKKKNLKIDHVKPRLLREFYGIILTHYRTHWRLLLGAFVALLFSVTLSLMAPWPLKMVLDYVILGNALPPGFNFLSGWLSGTPEQLLLTLTIAFFAINMGQSFISFIYKIGIQVASTKIETDFRQRLFAQLQRMALRFRGQAHTGDIVYRLTNDVLSVRILLVRFPKELLTRFLVISTHVGLMCMLNWQLALIAFSILPVIFLGNLYFGTGVQTATRKKKKEMSKVSSVAAETIQSMALIQAYGREDLLQKGFSQNNRASMASSIDAIRYSKLYKRFNDVLIAFGTGLVLYFAGNYALGGAILPGTVVLFAAYLKRLYGPLDKFVELLVKVAAAQVSVQRLLELLKFEILVEDDPDAVEAPVLNGPIEFKDVTFGYQPDRPVLKNINFTVNPGEKIAIIGPSGAGKSTLMSLLCRFYDPQQGEIRINHQNIQNFKLKSLRAQITILLQDAPLFNQTIRENIVFGKPNASMEEVVEAAKIAQAHNFIEKLPRGYHTMVYENGQNLSGGERQRIHIARAVIRNTPILILDEPTTALDPESEQQVHLALEKLMKGKTVFMIAHKMNSIVQADRILVLENGQVQGFGTHKELYENNAYYRRFIDTHFGQVVQI